MFEVKPFTALLTNVPPFLPLFQAPSQFGMAKCFLHTPPRFSLLVYYGSFVHPKGDEIPIVQPQSAPN